MGTMARAGDDSTHPRILLAIDVGMRAGFAWFDEKGTLVRARSTRFAKRMTLKRALPSILSEIEGVAEVVLEGQGEIADIFKKGIQRASLPVLAFSAEEWREDMLLPRERRTGQQAKATAEAMALKIAHECGNPPKCAYDDDAAEAVLFGLWYIRHWLKK